MLTTNRKGGDWKIDGSHLRKNLRLSTIDGIIYLKPNSHICEISSPIKPLVQISLILNFYILTCKSKYSYTIMYACKKSPPSHKLSYIGLFIFFHLNLSHISNISKN
jgi:hypothetical protein